MPVLAINPLVIPVVSQIIIEIINFQMGEIVLLVFILHFGNILIQLPQTIFQNSRVRVVLYFALNIN